MDFGKIKTQISNVKNMGGLDKTKIDNQDEVIKLNKILNKGLKKINSIEEKIYFEKLSKELTILDESNILKNEENLYKTNRNLKDLIQDFQRNETYVYFNFTGIEKINTNDNQKLLDEFGLNIFEKFSNLKKEILSRNIKLKDNQLENLKNSIKNRNLKIINYVQKRKKELLEIRSNLKKELIKLKKDGKKDITEYELENKSNTIGITIRNAKINKIKKNIREKEKILDLTGANSYIWIINQEIKDNFHSKDRILIENADLLSKYYAGKVNIIQRQDSLYDASDRIKEIEKMFNSKVLENGDFEGSGFFGWDTFDSTNKSDSRFLAEERIKPLDEISLLTEENEIIELKHTIGTIVAIIPMMIPYIGVPLSAGADIYDLSHINKDAITEVLKKAGIIPNHFQIKKEIYEMALAGAGIGLAVFGLQSLAKTGKLTNAVIKLKKLLKKIPSEQLDLILSDISHKMNFSKEKIKEILNLFKNKIGSEKGNFTKNVQSKKGMFDVFKNIETKKVIEKIDEDIANRIKELKENNIKNNEDLYDFLLKKYGDEPKILGYQYDRYEGLINDKKTFLKTVENIKKTEVNFIKKVLSGVEKLIKKDKKNIILFDLDETILKKVEGVDYLRPSITELLDQLKNKYPDIRIGILTARLEVKNILNLFDTELLYSSSIIKGENIKNIPKNEVLEKLTKENIENNYILVDDSIDKYFHNGISLQSNGGNHYIFVNSVGIGVEII